MNSLSGMENQYNIGNFIDSDYNNMCLKYFKLMYKFLKLKFSNENPGKYTISLSHCFPTDTKGQICNS